MKNPNNTVLKTFLLLAFSLFAVFVITSDMKEGSKPAQAGSGQNMSGWAWAETIGWISFNSDDCKHNLTQYIDNDPPGCPPNGTAYFDYGVNIDTTKNPMELSGYAWSENVGWISFERNTAGDPPFDPYSAASGPIATFSLGTLKMSGWAKILSLGDDGWIKLASSTETPGDTMNYAVELNPSWGEFAGWAWNGNDTASTGIGWISFNHENHGGATHYAVKGLVPSKPTNLKVATGTVDACKTLRLTWTDSSHESGYYFYRSVSDPVPLILANRHPESPGLGADTVASADSPLAAGTGYNYILQAYNLFGQSNSDQAQGTTSPICQVDDTNNNLKAIGKCPKDVILTWKEPEHDTTCTIDKYFIRRCACSTTNDCNNCNCDTNGSNCNPEVPSPYSFALSTVGNELTINDNNFDLPSQEQKKAYKYIVSGHCSSGITGEWSLPSNAVIPCKTKPKFIEDKPGS